MTTTLQDVWDDEVAATVEPRPRLPRVKEIGVALRTAYPSQVMPRGAAKRFAARLGASTSAVSEAMKRYGFTISPTPRTPGRAPPTRPQRYCLVCGIAVNGHGRRIFCRPCVRARQQQQRAQHHRRYRQEQRAQVPPDPHPCGEDGCTVFTRNPHCGIHLGDEALTASEIASRRYLHE